jgi:hypothetical protein
MRRRFLIPPRGVLQFGADALRVLGLVSVVVAAVWWSPTDAGVLAFVLLGLVIPRFLGMTAWLDIGACVALLVAGWSSVLDLYRAIEWWDLAVHATANAATAAMAYLLLVRVAVVAAPAQSPRWVVVFLCSTLGLAGGAVWELLEWAGHTLLDDAIFVAYDDTIGDMAAGALGSLVIGLLVARRPALRPDPPASRSVDEGSTHSRAPRVHVQAVDVDGADASPDAPHKGAGPRERAR